jgi:surface antigen
VRGPGLEDQRVADWRWIDWTWKRSVVGDGKVVMIEYYRVSSQIANELGWVSQLGTMSKQKVSDDPIDSI